MDKFITCNNRVSRVTIKIQQLEEEPPFSTKPVPVRKTMEKRNKIKSRVPPVVLDSADEIYLGDAVKGKPSEVDRLPPREE